MKAVTNSKYGSPQVLRVQEVERPAVKDNQLLVQVLASPVTHGDRRLRAADFPGFSKVPGRLMMGVFSPRAPIPGTMYAGRVVAVGSNVTRFAVGDDVFGSCDAGAHAEFLSVDDDSVVASMPTNLSYEEAAAVPYGAITAKIFMGDMAKVQPGQKVLVVGASGTVARFAVQFAKHYGAQVTGVCSSDHELVRSMGADHVIDYRHEDFTQNGQQYDVIFDTSGAVHFGPSKKSLTARGTYLTLYMSVAIILQMLMTAITRRKRAMLGIAIGSQKDIETVRALVESGAIRPVVAARFPLHRVVDAHTHLEQVGPHGSVVLTVDTEDAGLRTPQRLSSATPSDIVVSTRPQSGHLTLHRQISGAQKYWTAMYARRAEFVALVLANAV